MTDPAPNPRLLGLLAGFNVCARTRAHIMIGKAEIIPLIPLILLLQAYH